MIVEIMMKAPSESRDNKPICYSVQIGVLTREYSQDSFVKIMVCFISSSQIFSHEKAFIKMGVD